MNIILTIKPKET